jgi:hypothetical protein
MLLGNCSCVALPTYIHVGVHFLHMTYRTYECRVDRMSRSDPAIHGINRTFTPAFGARHPEKVMDDFFRINSLGSNSYSLVKIDDFMGHLAQAEFQVQHLEAEKSFCKLHRLR